MWFNVVSMVLTMIPVIVPAEARSVILMPVIVVRTMSETEEGDRGDFKPAGVSQGVDRLTGKFLHVVPEEKLCFNIQLLR